MSKVDASTARRSIGQFEGKCKVLVTPEDAVEAMVPSETADEPVVAAEARRTRTLQKQQGKRKANSDLNLLLKSVRT